MNPIHEFEEDFKKYIDSPYVVAVNSGTAALHTALVALGIGQGDGVITTPFTFPATANAILLAGATPVFVDILEHNNLIDPERIDEICKKTLHVKAVIPVHLFGRACEMETIMNQAEKWGLKVIEDASQAVGAKYFGKPLGTFGDAGTYSFYASKNLSAYQGGMITTPHEEVYRKARMFRNHGFNDEGEMETVGMNYMMPWNCAFHAQQYLYNHKIGIEAELGKVSEKDGYYEKLVYQHRWYQENPRLWVKMSCPVAEHAAKMVRKR